MGEAKGRIKWKKWIVDMVEAKGHQKWKEWIGLATVGILQSMGKVSLKFTRTERVLTTARAAPEQVWEFGGVMATSSTCLGPWRGANRPTMRPRSRRPASPSSRP